ADVVDEEREPRGDSRVPLRIRRIRPDQRDRRTDRQHERVFDYVLDERATTAEHAGYWTIAVESGTMGGIATELSVRSVNGLHHITAIAGPAQENLDFYAGILGMRLVKKSVNQDDPGTYHLFYAD